MSGMRFVHGVISRADDMGSNSRSKLVGVRKRQGFTGPAKDTEGDEEQAVI